MLCREHDLRHPENGAHAAETLKLGELLSGADSISVQKPLNVASVQGFAAPAKVVEMLKRWRPILAVTPPLLRFAVYLIASPFRDERSGQSLLSEQIVYRVFGFPVKEYTQKRPGGRVTVGQLLTAYREHVDRQFEWSRWDSGEGKCRITLDEGIPRDIRETYTRLMPKSDEKKIIAPSMKVLNSRNRKVMRQDERDAAESYDPAEEGGLPASKATLRVCRYMNSLPPRAFRPVRSAYADMREAARSHVPSQESRQQTVKLIDRIGVQPVPVYRAAGFTARPVAPNSLQQLPALLRAMAFDGEKYASLDLGKCQLAIAVRDWQSLAPDADTSLTRAMLNEQLAGNHDIWDDLQDFTGLNGAAGKAAVKRGTYGVVYGANDGIEYTIREGYRAVSGEYPRKEKVSRFREQPMIAELLEAREKALTAVRRQGETEDAFGRWLSLEAFQSRKNPARSLLACLAQTRELWLMMPAFELAKREAKKYRPNLRILLYVYDGIVIKARQSTEARVREVQQAVNERAERGGYLTRLERE